MVAILDPRLATARYGGFLRASLPPFWATTDPAVARDALRRLAARTPDAVLAETRVALPGICVKATLGNRFPADLRLWIIYGSHRSSGADSG